MLAELSARFGEPAATKVHTGGVVDADGVVVDQTTVLRPRSAVYLYRDLPDEVPVPFEIPVLYVLVDHLRWLERECLTLDRVTLRDVERYMGVLGADVQMVLGEPWRVDRRPYGRAALSVTASCLKGFYLHQADLGVNTELSRSLNQSRLPSPLDRRRAFLGHATTSLPANPLAPRGPRCRHPKMLPDGARENYWGPWIRLGTDWW